MTTRQRQIVVYRPSQAQDPTWQFYSMPESIVGGGATIDEARERYRDALMFSLELKQEELPPVTEFLEREVQSSGIWVRTPLHSHLSDRSFRQVASQIAGYGEEELEWFFQHSTAGGDPVVIPGSYENRLSSIFAQMTGFDSLIVAIGHFVDEALKVVWIVIDGVDAHRDVGSEKALGLEKLGLTPDSTLREVLEVEMQMYGDHRPAPLLAPVPA